ncbi:S8 family peptidase [Aureicoccus marinus]|uniref:S8 family peptidase n=1 Tax=Aureicoccus marinus TaxID=754435 RepID=UPI001FE2E8C2|nr:S8 family peptidase [Aureicoccus marinus]
MASCGSTTLVSTPVENIDTLPSKIMELTDAEKQRWAQADLVQDTLPGISLDRAYAFLGKRKGATVVVAVLDSGIDLDHNDLDDVIWTNKGEKAGNGKDDDGNGYVDDIHGYNFLGESYNEQLESARMLRLQLGDAATRAKAQAEIDAELPKAQQNKAQYTQILAAVKQADAAVKKELNQSSYTKEDLARITKAEMQQSVGILKQMFLYGDSIEEVLEEIEFGVQYFTEQANYNYNVQWDGRAVVGDNPYDFNDRGYGNGDPSNRHEDEMHGTHVAGIIAAERNNGIGVDGVAKNVQIMSIRAVPNGDEYDKDIALGIRYAVDNGARIINCSFGKSFSPNAEWVYEAIQYAASKDVLIVHAAGNDSHNIDDSSNPNYPNDHRFGTQEIANNVITIGSLAPEYGPEMLSVFSNYGARNVDLFAPGSDIYSTVPGSEYDYSDGTSMAAPAVSGVAALIRSYYPKLSAVQVKQILMQSGLTTKTELLVPGQNGKTARFNEVAKSGKMLNAYNALLLADQVSKGKASLALSAK